MTARRIAITTGAVGLAAGIALGANGLASAAGSATPAPKTPQGPAAVPPPAPGDGHGFRPGGPGGHGPGGRGQALVVSSSSGSLVLRTPRGEQKVAVTATTTYLAADGTKGTAGLVTPGTLVHVRLKDPRATSPVATEVRIAAAHLDGYITKVDNGTFTILDSGGFVRTVTTTAATTFRKDGAAATPSAFPVGTFVTASGTADGTDLKAAQVASGRPDRPDGPGRPDAPGDAAPDA